MEGWLVVLWLLLGCSQGFMRGLWLPGLSDEAAPLSYCEEEKRGCQSFIQLFVNRLDSTESALPYEYNAFDFCQDERKIRPSENLGQVLLGDRITSSPYQFLFKKEERCQKVCMKSYDPKKPEDKTKLDFLKKGMQLNYQHHWIVDNMPVTWCYDTEGTQKFCDPGFPVGCFITLDGRVKNACVISDDFNKKNTFYLFNHVDITVLYHSGKDENWPGARLVSVRLQPESYKHTDANMLNCDSPPMEIPAEFDSKVDVVYTYSVRFEENNDIKWASRWDFLLETSPRTNVQWFSLMISLAMVLLLSGMVAMIFLRTLHKDIARYNQTDSSEDAQKKCGWMLVHGDVFRPPKKGILLSVFLGQGTQIFMMVFITLFLACLGFLTPVNRGALMTCMVVVWVLMGAPAGYVSARMYKTFGGEKWKTNVLLMAVLCPGFVFAPYSIVNVIYWVNGSSDTVPSGTLVTVLAMWFGMSVPLTFLGSYFGFKKPIEHPVPINEIPHPTPEQSFKKPLLGIIVGTILPFGCIVIQLCFILNSIWFNLIFHMFGFLFLAFIMFVITCSEVTILLCYSYLRAEDYHWWWRSFLIGSFTAVYFFFYAVSFFSRTGLTGTSSTILYFSYTMIVVLLSFLCAGTIGFFATFWFVRKVYSNLKVDPAPLSCISYLPDPMLTHEQQGAKDLNVADVGVAKENLEVQVKS